MLPPKKTLPQKTPRDKTPEIAGDPRNRDKEPIHRYRCSYTFSSSYTMLLYTDAVSGDEMFSDAFPLCVPSPPPLAPSPSPQQDHQRHRLRGQLPNHHSQGRGHRHRPVPPLRFISPCSPSYRRQPLHRGTRRGSRGRCQASQQRSPLVPPSADLVR